MHQLTVKLAESITRLTALTKQGEICWHGVAPTVYAAKRKTEGVERALAIQHVSEVRSPSGRVLRTAGYVFQVGLFRPDTDPELVIDTRQRPDLADAVRGLYEAAKVSADARAVDVLSDLTA